VKRGECRRCGKTGHCARVCPTKPKDGAAHVAQGEEEEPTLLMAMLSSIQIHPRPPAAGVNAVAVARPVPWRGPVHMEEARAFV